MKLSLATGLWLLAVVWTPFPCASSEQPDLVVADFEGDTYGTWQAEGEAFGPAPDTQLFLDDLEVVKKK
jgi:hypothetical protein